MLKFNCLQNVYNLSSRKLICRSISTAPIAFVFDIDGVLLQSRIPILPQAALTLNHLEEDKIPHILLTNGGGQLESSRTSFINSVLDSHLKSTQIVQSHTPMKNLVNKFRRVLVVGGPEESTRTVAKSYGFEQVIRPIDVVRANPSVWPFHKYTPHDLEKFALNPSESKLDESIDAILVFNDPRDMGTDLQIISELLNSKNGVLATSRNKSSKIPGVPIIWSNMDLLWSTGYPLPRFGQGAFRIATRALYEQLNDGAQLEDKVLGKPWEVSFAYAEWVLGQEWKRLNGINETMQIVPELGLKPTEKLFKKVYMVGDNPESDIKGGNNYGWETILVKTGVYKDGDFERNGNLARPTFGVFDNVYDGVEAALKANGFD